MLIKWDLTHLQRQSFLGLYRFRGGEGKEKTASYRVVTSKGDSNLSGSGHPVPFDQLKPNVGRGKKRGKKRRKESEKH